MLFTIYDYMAFVIYMGPDVRWPLKVIYMGPDVCWPLKVIYMGPDVCWPLKGC